LTHRVNYPDRRTSTHADHKNRRHPGGLLPFRKAAAIADAAGPKLTDGNQIMHQILKEDIISAPGITSASSASSSGPVWGSSLGRQASSGAAHANTARRSVDVINCLPTWTSMQCA
jgi:hypothetical protein